MHNNLSLVPGSHSNLQVAPRWPYKKVVVCREAFCRLQRAQEKLGNSAQLVVTRGFEPGSSFTRTLHGFMRKLGSLVFLLLYPARASEVPEIFSANGHDEDGTHVDVAIQLGGRILKLLPFGVLTPVSRINAAESMHAEVLLLVREALSVVGFRTHQNQTEALQIHCDLTP
jgi:hypothetical protein